MLASTLAAGLAPAAALGLMLALTGAAVVIIGRHARRPPEKRAETSPRQRSRRRFPLRSGALRHLLVTAALANAALTATEVALTAYVRHHQALWAAGPLLAEVSAGSILGSLLLGTRTSAGRLPRLLACYAGGLGLLTAPASTPRCSPWPLRWPGCSSGRRWPPCSARRRPRPPRAAARKRRPG